MDETQLVDCLDGKNNLCNVEPRDILGKDFILDEHSHQVSTGQELHQHVEEVGILERCEELDNPGAVRLSKNISLGSDVR